MDNSVSRTIVRATVILSLGAAGGLIASTALASRAVQQHGDRVRRIDQTMSVTGSARKRIISDTASWRITVQGEAKELKQAYQILRQGCDRIEKFLADHKFETQEVVAGSISTVTHYARDKDGVETRELLGYTLARTYHVTTSRVDAIAKPAAEITELIQDGIKVLSGTPEYTYSKLADLKIEMIGEATKDARARAEQVVQNAGCVIAEVRTARVGVRRSRGRIRRT